MIFILLVPYFHSSHNKKNIRKDVEEGKKIIPEFKWHIWISKYRSSAKLLKTWTCCTSTWSEIFFWWTFRSYTRTKNFVWSTNRCHSFVSEVYFNLMKQFTTNQLLRNQFVRPINAKYLAHELLKVSKKISNHFEYYSCVYGNLFFILGPTSAARNEVMNY